MWFLPVYNAQGKKSQILTGNVTEQGFSTNSTVQTYKLQAALPTSHIGLSSTSSTKQTPSQRHLSFGFIKHHFDTTATWGCLNKEEWPYVCGVTSPSLQRKHKEKYLCINTCCTLKPLLQHGMGEVSCLPLAFIFTSADLTVQLFNSLG